MSTNSRLRGERAVTILLVEKQELCPLSILRGSISWTVSMHLDFPRLKQEVSRQKLISADCRREMVLGTWKCCRWCSLWEMRHKFTVSILLPMVPHSVFGCILSGVYGVLALFILPFFFFFFQ